MSRSDEVLDLIQKGEESLEAATVLVGHRFYGFACSRAYYAMFYAAEALLLTRGLSYSKHQAVISAFGREFVKTGLLPRELHRYLIDGYDLRQTGDYGATAAVSAEKARKAIDRAGAFLKQAKEFLRSEDHHVPS